MALRDSWIEKRETAQAVANGNRNMSQMHFARLGVITEEMEFVARRESSNPSWCAAVARDARSFLPTFITATCSRWELAWPSGARSTPI